jgi:choline-sulfatase
LPSLFVLALILDGLMSSLCLAQTPKSKTSNVFLVTIDTLRADHVGCYGYSKIQTPALDALAKDGIRFAEAFTPSPLTNSSHATILTGLLPSSHGVNDFAAPLAESHPTLAELLKARGYRTAAFIGAVVLDSKTLAPGLDRGFDFYDNFPATKNTSHWDRLERRGAVVVQHAQAWLTAHPAGPHFAWVHLYDPHDPYEPPAPYSQTYKNNLYDGEIAYADSALGKFVAYLKQQGWYDDSLVIIVGDHGEGLGDHGEDTHGIFLYDTTTHVPLIMKLPGKRRAGQVVNAQVRTTDILPTVLNVLGAENSGEFDGRALTPYFDGKENSDRIAYGETDYPLRFGWAPLRSVRTDGEKFIEAPKPELYDLHLDPAESKNLYEPWSEPVKNLRAMLAKLREKAPPAAPSKATVGQGTIDELKALGYLGPSDAGSSTNVPEPSMLSDPKDRIEEQNLLHKAMMASQDNRPSEARQALERVLQLNPKSSLALRQLGEVEVQTGDYAAAAEHLKRAREANRDDMAVAFLLGRALRETKDLNGARAVLEEGLKTHPNEPQARLLLGQVYLDLANADAARDQFEAVLLVQPSSVEGQLGLARALIAGKNFSEAVNGLTGMAKSQPTNADVFTLLAEAYRGLGKNVQAQEAETRAKALRTK